LGGHPNSIKIRFLRTQYTGIHNQMRGFKYYENKKTSRQWPDTTGNGNRLYRPQWTAALDEEVEEEGGEEEEANV
jgi:hypothetical protein